MQSEVDSLKQRIFELEVKKAELEAKNAELLKQVMEESTKRKAENIELKTRIEELEKNKIDTTNLKAENDKLNARVVKLEQLSNNITHELENSVLYETSSDISSNICAPPSKSKSLEDIETDNFLDTQSKKEVSNIMIKKNREKKLLRSNEAPAFQTQESHNTLPISDEDNSSEILLQSNVINGTENIAQVIADGIQDNILSDLNHVIEISATARRQNSDTISLLDLAQLFDKATDAEHYAMKANQEEILCWISYRKKFVFQYNDLIKNSNRKIGEKKVKGIIYDKILKHLNIICERRSKEMALQLPEISHKTLCKKIQKTVKTYKLFEKISIDKIKYLKAYSANSISELTNEQI
ncbi:hypothetical protein Glove_743g9 [Diversispora epigaea]|uniref:Uncharacterized protein n=1 Tax=Diversispora epigaea TaxID=1348612 RepID=A0A397G4P6_9GLOM|nr:hypothetical protein Glove_743g9 [Diversispora epigaea]